MAANSNKAALNIKDVTYKKRDSLWDAFDINNEPSALWAWGYNGEGQLGNGTVARVSSPVQIGSLNDWSLIAQDSECAHMIKRDGTLWAWGYNVRGQLGDGTVINRSSPVKIGNLTNWFAVAGSSNYETAAIKTDGTLWTWGNSVIAGSFLSSPVQVGVLTNWLKISEGYAHGAAIKTDGTIWAWGANAQGQLGLGHTSITTSPSQIGGLTTWNMISCGKQFTGAIKNDSTLWMWGMNGNGELGDGTTTNKSSPVQIGSGYAIICCGRSSVAQGFSVALKTNGTLWAWGMNNFGQLGDGTITNRSSPVQIGSSTDWTSIVVGHQHTLALKTDGTLWAWGYNGNGELGDNSQINKSSPIRIGALTTWKSIGACSFNSYAIK